MIVREKDYLAHHGIKGQKWGIRRFQKKDGSLTSAGKKRYNESDSSENKDTNKSTKQSRTDKLYDRYKSIGYSEEEAKQRAKGQVTAERILIGVGAVAVSAAIAYGAYKYYDNNIDRVISGDTMMQTVHYGGLDEAKRRIESGNPFYATYGKKDNIIYSSPVFTHFTSESSISKFYAKDGIKVASRSSGAKVLNDLIAKDPEVENYVLGLKNWTNLDGKSIYDKFNYSLVIRNDTARARKIMGANNEYWEKYFSTVDHDKIHKKFYDALKEKGYGAVIDVNDSKTEGFTFNPVIVFGDQVKRVASTTKANPEDLKTSSDKYKKAIKYVKQRYALNDPMKSAVGANSITIGSAYIGLAGITGFNDHLSKSQFNFVMQYKADHPNTRLSDSKIAEMYYTKK